MSEINVLDASAVLAYLLDEKGGDFVDAALDARPSRISTVNLCEVLGKLLDHGMPTDQAMRSVNGLRMEVVVFDEVLSLRAATLRTFTKTIGASLGDRACLSLAGQMAEAGDTAFVCTGERTWPRLNWPFRILLIR